MLACGELTSPAYCQGCYSGARFLFNQLLRQNRPDAFDQAAAEIPLNPFDLGRWNGFQSDGFELQSVLLIPDPPALGSQPFPGIHRSPDLSITVGLELVFRHARIRQFPCRIFESSAELPAAFPRQREEYDSIIGVSLPHLG
jgi:hypothetical protein